MINLYEKLFKEMEKKGETLRAPEFWGRRNYSASQLSHIMKVQLAYYTKISPEGYRIKYCNFDKMNYTYVVRHPKKLKITIK